MMSYKQIWEAIAEGVKEDILDGRYNPKERLKEAELAAKYSVSKTPVREALRYLERIGFVEIIPHTMAYVRPIDKKEIENLYSIQSALEALAVRLAIQDMGENEYQEMERQIKLMKKYYKGKNYAGYERANIHFQSVIWKASNNEELIEMLQNIFLRVQRFRSVTRRYSNQFKNVVKPHRQMLNAIIRKDGERAEKLVGRHIEEFGKEIVRLIEKEKG